MATGPRRQQDEALATTLAIEQGVAALRTGNATTALACFDEALAHEPGGARAALHRAHALAQLGRIPEALAAARDCASAHPGDEEAAALVLRYEGVLRDEAKRVELEQREREAGWVAGGVVDHRWEVFGEAHGGMGRVYFVRDRDFDGLELAVKTLAPRPGASRGEIERARAFFLRETQVWLDLGAHPHIVSAYYTLEVHGALRFFMEYVPGLSLEEVLRRARGALPIAHALDLAIQLCAAVEYVHARGALHRDLKSGNCLVMEDGTLRLTDFGLGTSTTAPRDEGETDTEGSLGADAFARAYAGAAGTPQYMAPEQWRSLAEAGPPADVYALGVLLYELCTGHYPFDATPASLARYEASWPQGLRRAVQARRASRELLLWLSHSHLTPLPMRDFSADAPADVEALALACLAKEPDERPSAVALREALVDAYRRATGRAYERPLPGAFEPARAGENNRAVSYAVMGETTRARGIFDAWLLREPLAPRVWLNRRVLGLRASLEDPARVAQTYFNDVRPSQRAIEEGDHALRSLARALAVHAPWPRERVGAVALGPDGATWIAAGDALHRLRELADADPSRDALAPERTVPHEAIVCSVCVSPDGSLVATGSFDRVVRLFSTRDGALVSVRTGHRDRVTALAFSPDGALVASAGGASVHREDRTVRLWSAARADALERVLRGHRGAVTAVAFAPDGARLASATSLGVVHLWDLSDDTLLYLFAPASSARDDERAAVRALGFSHDGGALWIARRDGSITVCDTASGEALARYHGSPEGLCAAAVDRVDGSLVAAYDDGTVRSWGDSRVDPVVREGAYPGPVHAMALAESPRVLLLAGEQGLVARERDGSARAPRSPWPLLIEPPRSAQGLLRAARTRADLEARLDAGDSTALALLQRLLSDAPELSLAREALVARLHRAGRAGAIPVSLREAWTTHVLALEGAVQWVGFCEGGQRVRAVLTAGAREGAASALYRVTWDSSRGVTDRTRLRIELDGSLRALALDAEGALVLVGFDAGAVALLRGDSGRVLRRFDAGAAEVTALALSADGALAAVGDETGQVRCVRCRDGALVARFRAHRRAVASLAFAPDASMIVSGGWDRVARVFSLRDGSSEPLRELAGHRGGVTAVAFAHDGRRILTAGDDGVRLWSLIDGARFASLEGFSSGVTCAAFSPGGRFVAAGGWEPAMRVFRARDGALERVLDGHSFGVACLAFSPGGDALVCAGSDGSLRRWLLDAEWRVLEALLDDEENAIDAVETVEALLARWRDLVRAAERPGSSVSDASRARLDALRTRVRRRLQTLLASARLDHAVLMSALREADASLCDLPELLAR